MTCLFFQFKTRCFIMMKSMKGCKREIKALMNVQSKEVSVLYAVCWMVEIQSS